MEILYIFIILLVLTEGVGYATGKIVSTRLSASMNCFLIAILLLVVLFS